MCIAECEHHRKYRWLLDGEGVEDGQVSFNYDGVQSEPVCATIPHMPLRVGESAWLTKYCLDRFLEASSGNVGRTLSRVVETMKWRNEHNIWEVLLPQAREASDIRREARSGKLYIMPHPDKRGCAVVVYRAGIDPRTCDEDQLWLKVYTMERACLAARERKIIFVVDYFEGICRNHPSVSLIKRGFHVLTQMYPRHLDYALLFNASVALRFVVANVFNWMPSLKRQKLLFSNAEDGVTKASPEDPLDWMSILISVEGALCITFMRKRTSPFSLRKELTRVFSISSSSHPPLALLNSVHFEGQQKLLNLKPIF